MHKHKRIMRTDAAITGSDILMRAAIRRCRMHYVIHRRRLCGAGGTWNPNIFVIQPGPPIIAHKTPISRILYTRMRSTAPQKKTKTVSSPGFASDSALLSSGSGWPGQMAPDSRRPRATRWRDWICKQVAFIERVSIAHRCTMYIIQNA